MSQPYFLIVDDDLGAQHLLQRGLARSGRVSNTVSTALEALDEVKANPGDIVAVLTDLNLIGRDGAWLCAEVKRVDPRIPVLLLTGGRIEAGTDISRFDAVVIKPTDFMRLVELVDQALRGLP